MFRNLCARVLRACVVIGLVTTVFTAVWTAAAIAQVAWAPAVAEQQIFVLPDSDPDEGFVSVEISGDTAIIGSLFDDIDNRVDQGSAYVFVRSNGIWQFSQKLIATDGEAGDFFGERVAISGDTAVIAARFADGQIDNQGVVYVFVRSGGRFVQVQKLTGDPQEASFGSAVALEGNTIVVGALFDTVGTNLNQGAAYVFTRTGGVFTRQQKLLASDGSAGARFGSSVALSGDTVLVGAPTGFPATVRSGAAYVFVRSASGSTFTETQRLAPSDAPRQAFGAKVALDGNTAAVSSQLSPVDGRPDQGVIFIYTRSGTSFVERHQLTPSDGAARDQFGVFFDLQADTLIAGLATSERVQGRAYVFTRLANTFTETQRLSASDGFTGDFFGTAVAVDGGNILISAPLAQQRRGAFYAFGGAAQQEAPSGLAATVTNNIVNLSWQPAAGATSYRLRAGTSPGGSNAFDGNVGAVTSLVATAPNGTYYVRVYGVSTLGESGPSNEVRVDVGTAGPGPCVALAAGPVFQTPSVTGSTVVLTWSVVQGATSYVVEAGAAPGLANLANLDTGNPATLFTAVSVPRGTYFVRVRAKNACSTSAPSNERTVVVP